MCQRTQPELLEKQRGRSRRKEGRTAIVPRLSLFPKKRGGGSPHLELPRLPRPPRTEGNGGFRPCARACAGTRA